ncbi:hypothetical protein ACFQ1E_17340 [Sphingomonas canadensis]|uniref:DUF3168 domain-containing protein n=1 Tax=Sphingomonas canadensis TaxID=1219257 RepID=A0ABW3HEL7_9SPHN|nr:hypothetical protein [Sphingomonas canadensis]MCW3837812.1 hypothetical protein [Sphingomonas canadensis]
MNEALLLRMTGAAPVAALAGDRIGWFERERPGEVKAWSDVLPALVLGTVHMGRGWTHRGPTGFDTAIVDLEAYALDPDAAMALARAALTEMERVPYADVAGVRFHPGMLAAGIEDKSLVDGLEIYRVLRRVRFNHQPIVA